MFGTATSRPSVPVRPAPGRVAPGGWFKADEAIMGTAIGVELWSDDASTAEAAIDAVMAEMHRIDRAMSPTKPDSELSRINRDAGIGPVPLSAEMAQLLARAQEFAEISSGAFDITYAAVGHLYDYRRGIAPDADTLQRARAAVGFRNLHLDRAAQTVRFARPGMRIDLGGFAKGHAVDNAAKILARHGVRHANVSAGGDSRVIGDRRGRPWTIGVRDPRRPDALAAVLPLEDVSISTSGDYERCFQDGAVRHHHIIDPATGRSADRAQSVTVLAGDGVSAEALSKIVFVLGVGPGLRLLEAHPGVDAIVVDADGALHGSPGLLQAEPACR